jgi:hypothetical protein
VRVNDPAVAAAGGFTVQAVAGVASRMQTVATFTDPGGAEPVGDYSATIAWGDNSSSAAVISGPVNGVFTVRGGHNYAQPGNYTVTLTIKHDTAPDAMTTSTANVSALVLHFSVAGFPSPTVAGDPGTFTVTALDQLDETVQGYGGTVHFTSSDPQALLPFDYPFTAADNGTHTFPAALLTAGSRSITATDAANSATGTQSGIVVIPAAADHFDVAAPTSVTAGQPFSVAVTARDRFGNVATGYTGTVTFASSDARAALPPDYMFTADDAGQHAFTVTLFTAAPAQTIRVTDTVSGITGSATITVTPAAASTLVVFGYPSPTGRREFHDFTVMALDPYGNIATGYRGTVHFTSDEEHADLPGDYTFTAADAGVHVFQAAFNRFGTFSLTATDTADPSITGTQSGIVVGQQGGGGGSGDAPSGGGGGSSAAFLKPLAVAAPAVLTAPTQLVTPMTSRAATATGPASQERDPRPAPSRPEPETWAWREGALAAVRERVLREVRDRPALDAAIDELALARLT